MEIEDNNEQTYFSITIQSKEEAMIGLLWQFDFESFQEEEDYVIGFIKTKSLTDEVKGFIQSVIERFTNDYIIEHIPYQNWNEIWESSFQPVIVGDFCQVRADFHAAIPSIQYDVIINPKMAFGTGHHATTFMMIEQMSKFDFTNKSVFDFGCGTGILAILASKLSAQRVLAIDIERESFLNTVENATINNVFNIESYQGEIESFENYNFDIILANINKNILLKYKETLFNQLNKNGILLISGILKEDIALVEKSFLEAGFTLKATITKDDWACMLLNN